MSNGPIHEAGETARSFVDVFRQQPYLLAMILINLGLLGFLYYDGVSNATARKHDIELLYDNRKMVAKLLAECYPSPIPKH